MSNPNVNKKAIFTGTLPFPNKVSMVHDGSDEWWDTANITELNGINKLTIETWVRPGTVSGSKDICAKWDYQTQGQFVLEISNDEVRVFIANALNDAGGNNKITDAANLVIDRWYHIVMVYDGTQGTSADRVEIYVDAVNEASSETGTIASSLQSASSTFKIGKFGGSLTRFFDGHINRIVLYPGVAFTQTEVTTAFGLLDISRHSRYIDAVESWRFGNNPLDNFNVDVANEWRMYGEKGAYNADSNSMELIDRVTEVPAI